MNQSPPPLNVDGKLLQLARTYWAIKPKARRLWRAKADNLIRETYPLNYDAIRAEWSAELLKLSPKGCGRIQ